MARRVRYGYRRRLKSFRAESGFPYDQYVWIYSRLYAFVMRRLHARGPHRYKRCGPSQNILWCHWCGDHQKVPDA